MWFGKQQRVYVICGPLAKICHFQGFNDDSKILISPAIKDNLGVAFSYLQKQDRELQKYKKGWLISSEPNKEVSWCLIFQHNPLLRWHTSLCRQPFRAFTPVSKEFIAWLSEILPQLMCCHHLRPNEFQIKNLLSFGENLKVWGGKSARWILNKNKRHNHE